MKEAPFDPNSIFNNKDATNVLRSAEEVRLDNLAKQNKTRKLGVSTMEKLDPKDVPSDDAIMREDERSRDNPIKVEGQPGTSLIMPYKLNVSKLITESISNRIRVTFGMDSGEISIPAIDVIECNYGIMVLIPAGLTDTVFTPKPGAHVVVKAKNKVWECFSPGTIFNLQFLDVIAVILIMETREAQ